ncbi:cob(I)yrinic acid a,c-diamide adenosyltransferase [Lachnoclostridium edouardi]|uniref:cob(I)yrinic acid a,c-diamide adenosyltransferase n=1 Tax=Lachnoclostridium edouardi TaxID=1926283 RepID=UPI000C79FD47|nr:cob(I)yrinic acid a,c-diamide adenosyltransferase [Lachnoclostridium edouardi]
MAEGSKELGLIHIYCGDGKGKTTASMGLALRAAGREKKVLIARFLKSQDSGEVKALSYVPNITVLPCEKFFGFTFSMSEETKKEAQVYYTALLENAWKKAKKEKYHMLILDEMMAACTSGLVSRDKVEELIKQKPEYLEVVLTGRAPWPEILQLADYVSEIQMVKHPFTRGVKARNGIEY